jgi:LacI family transcriptional regulator
VAPATRARILKLVADLGYTPNPLARALRSARTGLIGLIVRDINDPFFSVAIAAMTTEAQRHGYSVVLGHVASSAHQAVALSEALAMGHCEGAVLLGDLRDQATLWLESAGRSMPFVGLWQGGRESHIPVVNVDNDAGLRLAVEHVIGLGHRRIAFLQGGRTGDGQQRREAFRRAVRRHGLRVPPNDLPVVANTFTAAAAAAERLLRRRRRPTAIVASTDVAAIGALKAASRLGLSVPGELSIVGFDDIPLTEITVPSLTTVHQPLQELSQRALAQLLELIARPQEAAGRLQVVQPTLVVRDSTGPPASA